MRHFIFAILFIFIFMPAAMAGQNYSIAPANTMPGCANYPPGADPNSDSVIYDFGTAKKHQQITRDYYNKHKVSEHVEYNADGSSYPVVTYSGTENAEYEINKQYYNSPEYKAEMAYLKMREEQKEKKAIQRLKAEGWEIP